MNEIPKGLIEKYTERIAGTLGCFDRVVLTGTLVDVGYPNAVHGKLVHDGLGCFELKLFADPLRRALCEHARQIAERAGIKIEHIRRMNFRKEERVARVLAERGSHPGLVHVFSAMECCSTFEPWHDRETGRTGIRGVPGKCLHFYFYFMHERLGLMYVRVQTWLPCRLQVYFNGHNWLAALLKREDIGFRMMDNAFVQIDNWQRAQALADDFSIGRLHRDLDVLARNCVPWLKRFPSGYHWSLMQVEYAFDIAWKNSEGLAAVYEEISRQAILNVKAPDVARFLGHPLPRNDAQVGSDFHTRVEGTRVKHFMGPASLKLYDKQARVLRIECVSNDVTFFKHHRKVEHQDGTAEYKVAPLKKSIYSMGDLRGLLHAATQRYLAFLGDLEDHSGGVRRLDKITTPVLDGNNRRWRGFNLFSPPDYEALLAVLRGEHCISGMSNRLLRKLLPDYSGGQMSRLLKRLRLHGLIKKIGHTYKYYVTEPGRRLLLALLKLREFIIIPTLCPKT
jgi:hypothetical protein